MPAPTPPPSRRAPCATAITTSSTAPSASPPTRRIAGISAFLVERGVAGLTVAKPYKKMGFRGSHTADVLFEDCRVPARALLGGREGIGFQTAMKSLDHARVHIAAVAVRMCEPPLDEGTAYALDRRPLRR